MTRLVLAFGYAVAEPLMRTGVPDCVIEFRFHFVWGKLPLNEKLEALLSPRPMRWAFEHWTEGLAGHSLADIEERGVSFTEFCKGFDAIEVWVDPQPSAQLQLIWLLDYLWSHESIASRMSLVQFDTDPGELQAEGCIAQRSSAVPIHADHLVLAATAWAAWRAPTPVAWSSLLSRDCSPLPQLRNTIIKLLEELPDRTTGLGFTEMSMLHRVAAGYTHPYDLIPSSRKPNDPMTYGLWEGGAVLDGLARCEKPAVSGLAEGPFDAALHHARERLTRYENSTLFLTDFGEVVRAGADDFRRHNGLHRWWGGTELTNDNLWRWDVGTQRLIAP